MKGKKLIMNLEEIKEWFYTHYEELDKGFSQETINRIDAAFREIEIIGSDIEDIESGEIC